MKQRLTILFVSLCFLGSSWANAQEKPSYQADSIEIANLQKFSNMIIDSVENGYTSIITRHLGKNEFFSEIWNQLDSSVIAKIPLAEIDEVKDGIYSKITGKIFPFVTPTVDNIGLINNYWSESGRPNLTYRFVTDGNYSYFDIELVYDGNSFRIADVYVYSTSTYLSTVTKNLLESSLNLESYNANENMLIKYSLLVSSNKWNEIPQAYEQLSEKEQQLPFVMIHYLTALSKQNKIEEAIDFSDKLIKTYPSNVAPYMQLIHIYDKLKDYKKCLAAVDSVDTLIGGDPYLNQFRAICNQRMGNIKEFVGYAKQVMEDFPLFRQMHYVLIDEALALKDKDALMVILAGYSKNFYVVPEIMKAIESSAGFMNKDERFTKWVADSKKEYEEWAKQQ